MLKSITRASAPLSGRLRTLCGTASELPAGTVLSWGTNKHGQLGRSGGSDRPDAVDGLPATVDVVAAGASHSLAVTDDGRVWTWGEGKYGILGHGGSDDEATPRLVEAFEGVEMARVSGGRWHSAALSTDGELFSWGWGGGWMSGVGALGLGDKDDQAAPVLVDALLDGGVRIADVSCGDKHTVACDTEGRTWAWGCGEWGRLGDGRNKDALLPVEVEPLSDVKVTQVSCGQNFSMALSEDGNVYVWGKNDHGQLGLGPGIATDVYSMEAIPRLLDDLEDQKVVGIAAGNRHAAAWTDAGDIYFWGARVWMEPRLLTVLSDEVVISASGGDNWSSVLTARGNVYTWGGGMLKGRSKALGHGSGKKRQATLLDGLPSVKAVSCGGTHGLAILGAPKLSASEEAAEAARSAASKAGDEAEGSSEQQQE
eukprot:PLAT9738.1.p1 GENE.PLAT9738.1~~PLAT9738.1.p1  ORF type:complete len:426 (+),score=186.57 PLAT9738.1:38-1315(+)